VSPTQARESGVRKFEERVNISGLSFPLWVAKGGVAVAGEDMGKKGKKNFCKS